MSDFTALRGGDNDLAGTPTALFLKTYGGEVLVAFREATEFLGRHLVRSIASGKSAQFPATWKTSADYHTVGNEMVGKTARLGERVITIDDILKDDIFIADIDEAMAHYDFRSEYTAQTGLSLANTLDAHVAQVGCLAARASATITGAYGGAQLTNAAYATDGAVIAAGLYDAAQTFSEKDVPDGMQKNVFLRPAQFYLLAQTPDVYNKDWTEGNNGGYDTGKVYQVADLTVVKTNHLPSTNIATGPSAYQGDFSNTVGLIMAPQAVGTVKLMDVRTKMEEKATRLGTFIVSYLAVGHGILRPECAVEMITA